MKNCFVILNYNDYKTTLELINNIKNFSIIDEIVIIDNNSSDDSYEHLKILKSDKITILKNNVNKGYSAGNNLGCKYLCDKYKKCNIFISNPDILIKDENILKKMIDCFKLNVGVVSPIIFENNEYHMGWRIPKPIDDILLNIPILYKKINKKLMYTKEYLEKEQFVEVVSGCFFLIRSDVLKKLNFFDENVFLYYEENILGKKLKNENIKTMICLDTKVIHNNSVTINKNVKKINKYKILKKSQMYFEKEYNGACKIELFLLWITSKITLIIYYICGYK